MTRIAKRLLTFACLVLHTRLKNSKEKKIENMKSRPSTPRPNVGLSETVLEKMIEKLINNS